MVRTLTLRGKFAAGGILKTLLDYEGVDLTRAWKIVGLEVLSTSDPTADTKGMVLHTDDILKTAVDFGDNQTIGWAGESAGANQVMDPNHMIVNCLYGSSLDRCTYILRLEKRKVSEIKNVMYQLKERAQGSRVVGTSP